MKKSLMIGLILMFALVASVFAYQGNPDVQGPYYTDERHEDMSEAFNSLDYSSWYNLMTQYDRMPGVLRSVNEEDNFVVFAEMREARLEGDLVRADALKVELGLGQGQMKRGSEKGSGQGGQASSQHGQGSCIYN